MGKLTTAAAVVILLIIAGYGVITYLPGGLHLPTAGSSVTSATTSALSSNPGASSSAQVSSTGTQTTNLTGSQGAISGIWLTDNPSFVGNSSKVDYPPDYGVLANFTLGLIDTDRASAGLSPIALSPVTSGQQHADSMAYFGTYGHWDVQGYKPYMRYTLLGGTGSVTENVALNSCTDSAPPATSALVAPCSLQTIENGISNAEYAMMNYDATCCNNGHRENILDSHHDRVSLGIAYDAKTGSVYLVEDFEDAYITYGSLQLSGSQVTFYGSTQQNLTGWAGSSSGAEIVVYYDATPTPINASEIQPNASCDQYNEFSEPASCQYRGAYNSGAEISGVFAPCPQGRICGSGNFTYAQTWQQNAGTFLIVFSIGGLESAHGNGVYTFYLWPDGDTVEPITSLSLFVTGR